MAPGHRGRLTALLTFGLLLVVSACTTSEVAMPATTAPEAPPPIVEPPVSTTGITGTTTTTGPVTTTTTVASTTTTVAPTSTTTAPGTTTTVGDVAPVNGADVRVPEGVGPFPTAVLVHGGGWVAGDPSSMSALAELLTENGYLTVNTPYKLASQDAGFPEALDDVACAVSYAATHPDSDGTVAVVGHSAGAHLSAVIGLTGERYGPDCPVVGPRVPDRLVGLAGPYDVERLGLIMLPFFSGGPDVEPEAWQAGNPMNLTAENTSLVSLIMYGGDDALVPPVFAIDFHSALTESGGAADIELVEGADHNDLRDPAWVGDLIVTWLER